MEKFFTGKQLEDAVYDIIWKAEKTLLILCPYIRLDDYFKKLFDKHQNNYELHIVVVFGKNEAIVSRSLSKDDIDYFKKFPNISIVYVANLHAKYYGNEKEGLISSINLHDYSFKNNIEFGVYSNRSVINQLIPNSDEDAWATCIQIAYNNDVVFIKRPVYENKKFIVNIGKKFVHADTLLDYTQHFYSKIPSKYEAKRLGNFPEHKMMDENYRPQREEVEQFKQVAGFSEPATPRYQPRETTLHYYQPQMGYCIRTGIQIPLNPSQPLSKEAWRVWNEFGNWDFPEKFCHKTGSPSHGRTSFRNPIL